MISLLLKYLIYTSCFLFVPVYDCANIFYYLGISSYSQHHLATPYLEALVQSGHNVTFFTPYSPKTNNNNTKKINIISPEYLQNYMKVFETGHFNVFEVRKANGIADMWKDLSNGGVEYCELWLKDTELQDWIKNSDFDLVIMDSFINECGLGLAYKWNTPHIIFSTLPLLMWHYDTYGIPPESSWIPDMEYGYSHEMSLIQKTLHNLRLLGWHFHRRYVNYPKMEENLRKYLEIPDMPDIDDLQRNPSLILINHHFSVDYAKSLPYPLFVGISGINIFGWKANPLPREIDTFLNKCENGFIYVSFGSFAEMYKLPENLQLIFFRTFELYSNVCFLVKWEQKLPAYNIGNNVLFYKWMPQRDILAHPKIRAFVMHGGLIGIQEAVYFSVPLIVFPIFAEQDYNAEKVKNVGYGLKLEITTLSQDEFNFAVGEILTNLSYEKKAEEISILFRDRPDDPLTTALWWTEYVLRNKNTSMMIPFGAKQTWYERRLLDVYALILILFVFIISIAAYIIKRVLMNFKNKNLGNKKNK